MNTANEVPENLKPYLFHGVSLAWNKGSKEGIGDCPFCGREKKFSVSVETGQAHCWTCTIDKESPKGGVNSLSFVRRLLERSREAAKTITQSGTMDLMVGRKLIHAKTLGLWGMGKSVITGNWLIPGYNADGVVCQLYKYARSMDLRKMILLATPGLHHGLFGVNLYNKNLDTVYLCEGPWDGMALWELWNGGGNSGGRCGGGNVLSVPGCGVWQEGWLDLCKGKKVAMLYDSDSAGYNGMKRVASTLAGSAAEISYLKWGEDGLDLTKPAGYDLRDYLTQEPDLQGRVRLFSDLRGRILPVPAEWKKTTNNTNNTNNTNSLPGIETVPCDSWHKLVNSWRKAMRWTEGLDRALSVMLACIVSTRFVGDQLWCKVIGPAACGKSTLCEALSVNKEYVLAKSTIRGFHSGYKTDGDGAEDHSLVAKLYNKTLVTKDGDTLLQSPNLPQILAEARDLYDSTSRTHYRNKIGRDYAGIRMTWILCGTSSLRTIDSSELGERFLDCVIMDGIDDAMEDEVLWRVVNRASDMVEANGSLAGQYDKYLAIAMQLTSGYINHLCANSKGLLAGVENPDEVRQRCVLLAKFTAYMRARPSKTTSKMNQETAERELGTRLACQITRLAKCLAIVLGKDKVDEEVMRRVNLVCMDTARGDTLNIVKRLFEVGRASASSLAIWAGQTETKNQALLLFLKKLDVLEVEDSRSILDRPKWRLSERIASLYDRLKLLAVRGG